MLSTFSIQYLVILSAFAFSCEVRYIRSSCTIVGRFGVFAVSGFVTYTYLQAMFTGERIFRMVRFP